MASASVPHPLRIATAERAAGDALVLTFEVPAALSDTFRFRSGQHIALSATLDGAEVRRNYSICAAPGEPLRVAIKRMFGGRFSNWAHDQLHAGMTIDVLPPSGRFILAPPVRPDRHIVLFAVGSGITPCLGITRQALLGESGTRVTLVYGNRRRDTTMFADEIEALKDLHLGRFDVLHLLSAEGEADVPLCEGRLGGDKVRSIGERLIDYTGAERIYLCGPGAMIKDVRDALLGLGVAQDRILHEFFAPPGAKLPVKPAAPRTDAAQHLTVVVDGTRHRVPVQAGQVVLDAALAAGVKVPYSCRGGMCSTCRARLVEGTANMALNYSLEPWELERGFILTCQAHPTSADLVIDYDAM